MSLKNHLLSCFGNKDNLKMGSNDIVFMQLVSNDQFLKLFFIVKINL